MITPPYIYVCHCRTPIFEENSRDVYICEGSITQKFLGDSKSVNLVILGLHLVRPADGLLQNLSLLDSVWGRTFKVYSSYTCWYLQILWGVGVWQGWYSSITLSRDLIFKKRRCEKLLDIEDAHGKDSGMLICYEWLQGLTDTPWHPRCNVAKTKQHGDSRTQQKLRFIATPKSMESASHEMFGVPRKGWKMVGWLVKRWLVGEIG